MAHLHTVYELFYAHFSFFRKSQRHIESIEVSLFQILNIDAISQAISPYATWITHVRLRASD